MSPPKKRIVLCSDGTGNKDIKGRGTNVFKLYEAVDLSGHKFGGRTQQIAFYGDGIGTEQNRFLKAVSGGVGLGLSRNVRELYIDLCRVYRPGDEIYLFGFSRGAHTVRVLAGFILECGVVKGAASMPDKELDRLVKKAYRTYRERNTTWQRKRVQQTRERIHEWRGKQYASKAKQDALAWRREHSALGEKKVPIRFLGVWDTVAAIGLPFKGMTDFWDRFVCPISFANYRLGREVHMACHALAVDDERQTFHPVLWDEQTEEDGRIEQVWFAGAHSNVGGGYPKQGMSLVALDWMMSKAEEAEKDGAGEETGVHELERTSAKKNEGLRFIPSERAKYRQLQNVHDKLYDPRAGLGVYYRYKPRDIAAISSRFHIGRPKIHVSLLERIAIGTQGYAPGNLPNDFEIVPSDTRQEPPGEDKETLERLVADIRGQDDAPCETADAPETQPLLLNQVRGPVWTRRLTHYTFLLLTVAVVVLATLKSSAAAAKDPMVPKVVAGAVQQLSTMVPLVGGPLYDYVALPFLVYPYFALALLGALVLLWAVGFLARRSAEKVFTSFWRRKMPEPWEAKPAHRAA